MGVLVIEHAPERADGVTRLLQRLKLDFHVARIYQNVKLSLLPDVSGVISTGGPMSIADIDAPAYSFLHTELRFLEMAIRKSVPVLGICLGHQLIAYLFGSPVQKSSTPEVGWADVELTSDGVSDILFSNCSIRFRTFHYHLDEVSHVPAGGTVLAQSARCDLQAFRIRHESIWGIQFHPDIFPDHGERILRATSQRRPDLMPIERLDDEIADGRTQFDEDLGARLLSNFLMVA